MALHNLKIIVVDGGRRSYSNTKTTSSKGQKKDYKNSPLYKMLNLKETMKENFKSGMTPSTAFAMDMGLRVATQLVKQTANYYISDIGRRNGDSNYQAMINREIEIVSDGLSFASSILSGAATGSMFGPAGAGFGALVGMTSSLISTGFKYAERERDYQHEMFKNNTSQAYSLARANYSALTGRVR